LLPDDGSTASSRNVVLNESSTMVKLNKQGGAKVT